MTTSINTNSQNKPINLSVDAKPGSFDFDLWAMQVKQQMLAALSRRGLK